MHLGNQFFRSAVTLQHVLVGVSRAHGVDRKICYFYATYIMSNQLTWDVIFFNSLLSVFLS